MGLILLPLALIAYFNGIFLALPATLNRSRAAQRGSAASLGVAWLLHLGAIVYQGYHTGRFPLNSAGEYLLALGWVVLTLYLLVMARWKLHQAGLVLPPLAALMALAGLLLPTEALTLPASQARGWFTFHVSISMLGVAALCVAFAMSLIYLVQDRALKSKRAPRILERLPSLDTCDRIGYHAVLWGFPLLTLGIATGTVLTYALYHVLWPRHLTLMVLFSLFAWLVLAVLLFARLVRGFRGRRSAYLTIAGVVLGLLTVIGMTR